MSNTTFDADALLEATLSGLGIPVDRGFHKGAEKQYITYRLLLSSDQAFTDDENETVEHYFRFDIFSKGNFIELLRCAKKAVKEAGFYSVQIGAEMYESDTGYFHIPVELKYLEVL